MSTHPTTAALSSNTSGHLLIEPIERPKSLYMRLVYWYSKMVFGKVMTPLKVVGARFPQYIGLLLKIQKAERKLKLDPSLTALLRVAIAKDNVCPFCVDIGLALAAKERIGNQRFMELDEFETSPQFAEAERLALRLAKAVNQTFECPPELFAAAKQHYTERQIIDIIWVVATENYYNRMNRPLGIHADGLHQLAARRYKTT